MTLLILLADLITSVFLPILYLICTDHDISSFLFFFLPFPSLPFPSLPFPSLPFLPSPPQNFFWALFVTALKVTSQLRRSLSLLSSYITPSCFEKTNQQTCAVLIVLVALDCGITPYNAGVSGQRPRWPSFSRAPKKFEKLHI